MIQQIILLPQTSDIVFASHPTMDVLAKRSGALSPYFDSSNATKMVGVTHELVSVSAIMDGMARIAHTNDALKIMVVFAIFKGTA